MKVRILGIVALIGGALVLALLAGGLFFGLTSRASARGITLGGATTMSGLSARLYHHGTGNFGPAGFMRGDVGAGDEYLAEALGITVEELEAARAEAQEAALQQAVEQGLLTEEQADLLRERDPSGRFGSGFGMHGFGMRGLGSIDTINFQALLADALGITVSELEAAQQSAHEAAMNAAVESGDLTQEQADLMLARHALRDYLDPQALKAAALGITIEQLQAYQADGLRMAEILEEVGLSSDEFQAAHQEAYETALNQAVSDGVITQEQADALQSGKLFGQGGFGGCGGMGGGRGGRGGGMHGFPGGGAPESTDPGPTTSGDA